MADSKNSDLGSVPDYWGFIVAVRRHMESEVPESDTLANRLFLSLNRASSTAVYDFESLIHRPLGSSWARFRIMLALWVNGPTPAHAVASLTGMSRATVSNLATVLVNESYVMKYRSQKDRRSVSLALTQDGVAHIEKVFTEQNRVESSWSEALTAGEVHVLIELLDKLMRNRNNS